MENRFKQDIEIERLENEHKEFKDAIYSFTLLAAVIVVVLQFAGILF